MSKRTVRKSQNSGLDVKIKTELSAKQEKDIVYLDLRCL